MDKAIADIAKTARASRAKTSRMVWIVTSIVGVASAIAFVVIIFADGAPSPATTPARVQEHGLGFATGLAIGIGVGIAIGYAIARQSRKSPTTQA